MTEARPLDPQALRRSFATAAHADPQFFYHVYERLAKQRADLFDPAQSGPTFPPLGSLRMDELVSKTAAAFGDGLEHLEDVSYLQRRFGRLGAIHAGPNRAPEFGKQGALGNADVLSVAVAILATLQAALGRHWTPYLDSQWTQFYERVIGLMRAGAIAFA